MKPPHHSGSFAREALAVRLAAYAEPQTRCWRCRLTLVEVQAAFPRRRVRWTAGHLVDGQAGGPLAAECSPCNFGAGAVLGNAQRVMPRSRRWY